MIIVELLFLAMALILAIPVVVLAIEIFAAVIGRSPGPPVESTLPPDFRLAVLVPAHNESEGLVPTLQDIKAQLGPRDSLVVIADNCTDDTASIARAAGAEVIERHDPVRRGKGYALDFGIRHLASEPPDVVVFIDADCRVGPIALAGLARIAWYSGRAVQARYIMNNPAPSTARDRVTAFAWLLKNHVRPLGLRALELPCQMMGTGMAVSWRSISTINLATGHVVEDVKLGLDLANAGAAPLYWPALEVSSEFPSNDAGLGIQRRRWEGGSLRVLMNDAPRLLLKAAITQNLFLAAMAADLLVPPFLLLLALHLIGSALAGLLFFATGSFIPFLISAASMLLLSASILAAWVRYGRNTLFVRDIAALPVLLLQKLPHYLGLWIKRNEGWVRTERD